jgi:phage tail sheath protein FI
MLIRRHPDRKFVQARRSTVSDFESPGVFVEEIPNDAHPIEGVSISRAAFIGATLRGEIDQPIEVTSFVEFEQVFGSRYAGSALGFAIGNFFENGGSNAIVVRVFQPEGPAPEQDGCSRLAIPGAGEPNEPLRLKAKSPGKWGDRLLANVRYPFSSVRHSDRASTRRATLATKLNVPFEDIESQVFTLRVHEQETGVSEEFLGLTVCDSTRRIDQVLQAESKLVAVDGPLPRDPPRGDAARGDLHPFSGGSDGSVLNTIRVIGREADQTGIYALEKADLFNLLCIPPYAGTDVAALDDVDPKVWEAALSLCEKRRAMLIVDPPRTWKTREEAAAGFEQFTLRRSANAALYFPGIRQLNPARGRAEEDFVPSGAIAGIVARIDAERAVWSAPAGTEATILGIADLKVPLTDADNGVLNALGINCLRKFPAAGMVVWGARTMRGADAFDDEYKYIPVRRTSLFIEESVYRGMKWAVFEPNAEPLWATLRSSVTGFMHHLFRQGAFQGSTPQEAFFVHCDSTTTTQEDIDAGRLNIVVGFAPLRPTEFVVISLQMLLHKLDP